MPALWRYRPAHREDRDLPERTLAAASSMHPQERPATSPGKFATRQAPSEQLVTLQSLHETKAQLLQTLRRLPVGVTLPSVQALRIETEYKLAEVDVALKAFASPEVFE